MMGRARFWLNSMQAYMIGFAFCVIALLTAVSMVAVEVAGPPRLSAISVYDVGRVILGKDTVRPSIVEEFSQSGSIAPAMPTTSVEQRISRLLAEETGRSVDGVSVYLGNRSARYFDYVERQLDAYDRDGRASPVISGTIIAHVREGDGTWRTFKRESGNGFVDIWFLLRASPWIGGLIILPFSMWFSTRIARPVRAFAQAASRVRDGHQQYPVPVIGPNETRIAAVALNEMQARIGAFIRERTTLVGAIAHDLRTPLNNLRFRIANAPEAIRAGAESDISQLDRLISSILDYAETDGKALAIETIDLTSLLQSLVHDNGDLGRDISIDAVEARIEGDVVMLRRLFTNLIENAFKYAGKVAVRLACDEETATVEIRDNGPGMLPDDLARAFEPFFRAERSRNRDTGGIGLGLPIALSIAEAHGGSLTIENAPDGGLLARVILPRGRA
ncbi:HAMP domain-containing sensor histidine kinase [Novosphingobium sp. TH158]|uniref:sensor histidine kinase n=1 Tax=Novosphingobium sp. TH158 TaxID=2067455 RepID=UPI000C7CDC6F|nr:HAMP domain-containing sensor histidine kinase [Novosphingobium sp. TH158]PLK26733.1 two-component sensor histidine kinase [Novosphingobium sp. TH158]